MSKIRKSARGECCKARIPGVCKFDNETVVGGHKNGGGMAKKNSDLFICDICSDCHAYVDALPKPDYTDDPAELRGIIQFYEGIFRTQQRLLNDGLITIKGE